MREEYEDNNQGEGGEDKGNREEEETNGRGHTCYAVNGIIRGSTIGKGHHKYM